jgi:DNA-binding transcriptional LysR family regulator
MEMQQVRYFLALAQHLNFTRAAEACNVSQPALTRAIQGLEGELGGALFHRERNQTHLSELGRTMLPYVQSILEQAEAARAHARSIGAMSDVELKLSAMCTLSPHTLADFVVAFRATQPGVKLRVVDGSANAMLDHLHSGATEIGVIGHHGELDDRFHAMPLYKERFVVVLPPQHRLARQNAVCVKDLNGEPYVNRLNCEVAAPANKEFRARGVSCPVVFRSERDDWVLGMIRSGMGWGFFPEFYSFPRDVTVRPLIDPEFWRTISLITVRGRPHSPAVGAFVRAARGFAWPRAQASCAA